MKLLTCGHISTDTKDININKKYPRFHNSPTPTSKARKCMHARVQKKALPSVKYLSRKKFLIKSYLTPSLKKNGNVLINTKTIFF